MKGGLPTVLSATALLIALDGDIVVTESYASLATQWTLRAIETNAVGHELDADRAGRLRGRHIAR